MNYNITPLDLGFLDEEPLMTPYEITLFFFPSPAAATSETP